ncbi:uncharacterized protein [Venturia canescens]|uniref:uncharacterized protein n=1 Tax=Venturia canescens TaxID=32260 RepID=UPI001C9C81EB|nr:uncharacterized protein LOC122407916 [Venturia canescens]
MATKNITFLNSETGEQVEIVLSIEDAKRAEQDLAFATTLMHAALQEKENNNTNVQESVDAQLLSGSALNESNQILEESAINSEDNGLYRWMSPMVLLLLDTYSQNEEKFSNGKYSQKKVWEEIADVMREKIPSITGPQCAAKMRSLKKTFKSIKDHNGKSGNDRRTWPFYENMERIFEKKTWFSPVAIASSSGLSTRKNDDLNSGESSSSPSPATVKTGSVASLLKKRLAQKEDEEKARAKRHKERIEMDEKFLAILSKFTDQK